MASRKEAAGSSATASKAKGKSAPGESAVKQIQIDGLVSWRAGSREWVAWPWVGAGMMFSSFSQ